jgi:hypothetical protein
MAKARQCVFPWGEAMRASITIRLVRAGLVISVEREHGTETDHIVSTPATLPWTK